MTLLRHAQIAQKRELTLTQADILCVQILASLGLDAGCSLRGLRPSTPQIQTPSTGLIVPTTRHLGHDCPCENRNADAPIRWTDGASCRIEKSTASPPKTDGHIRDFGALVGLTLVRSWSKRDHEGTREETKNKRPAASMSVLLGREIITRRDRR